MSDKKNKSKDFDPQKNMEVEKGPLKSKHKNAYRTKDDDDDRPDRTQKIPKKPGKSDASAKS